MGVDFFPCNRCQESICDCGDYIRCDCGYKWCSLECAMEEGFQKEDWGKSCSFCRKEDAEDYLLLQFLLERYNLSRMEVVKDYYLVNKDDDEDENSMGNNE